MYREFDFIKATFHNRACFIQVFWKCFRNIGRKEGMLKYKLCTYKLICSDQTDLLMK